MMSNKIYTILAAVFSIITLSGYTQFIKDGKQPENHRPEVTIIRPENRSSHPLNGRVRYTIRVSDQEDGESKYQEIPSNEVFLKVQFVSDTTQFKRKLKQAVKPDAVGLATIRHSNCLNCHEFKSTALGPSFVAINKKYNDRSSYTDTLEQHILEGSTGVWGAAAMPSHPELSKKEVQQIVSWIMNHAGDPTVNYYSGTRGTFQLKVPDENVPNGAFILTASYTDHGTKDLRKQTLRGYDTAVIFGK